MAGVRVHCQCRNCKSPREWNPEGAIMTTPLAAFRHTLTGVYHITVPWLRRRWRIAAAEARQSGYPVAIWQRSFDARAPPDDNNTYARWYSYVPFTQIEQHITTYITAYFGVMGSDRIQMHNICMIHQRRGSSSTQSWYCFHVLHVCSAQMTIPKNSRPGGL